MDQTILDLAPYKTALFGVWLALLFSLERWRPAAPRPETAMDGSWGWKRVLRNIVLIATGAAMSALVVLPVTIGAASLGWVGRPVWWSGWWAILIDCLILDLWIYWWHRANHEVPFLWRFHEIHHLDHFLDTTTALRFHYGELFFSAFARAPVIIILGIPFASVLVFEALVILSALFHHSNVRLPAQLEAALSRIIVTPSIHWVHHHKIRQDTDSNYATVLSLWDRLFRSRSATKRRPDLPIGVEREHERTIFALLLRPLRLRP